jgi:zinc transport system permease protein
MSDFVIRALAGGGILALITGPVGALMLWRKRAFFGAAIAEGAILGVVGGLFVGAQPLFGAALACIVMALAIEWFLMDRRLSDDTVIGVIGHAALAGALVIAVYLSTIRIDFLNYLFGDILAVTWDDVTWSATGALLVLVPIVGFWKPLILATAEPEIAAAEGVPVNALTYGFAVILATVVALGLQLVGALLIIALLVMPAAAARRVSRTPGEMAIISILFAAASIAAGIALSFRLDWPAGPAVALAATALFFLTLPFRRQ